MADIRLRPRFREQVPCSPEEVLQALEHALGRDTGDVNGSVFSKSAVLRIPPTRQHYWSPELQIGVDPSADRSKSGGPATTVTGIFGPRPAVWSLFIALYAFVAFGGTMGGAYGLSQLMLDQPAHVLWAVPAALVLAVVIYFVGQTGRALGHGQMTELRAFLDRVLGELGPS